MANAPETAGYNRIPYVIEAQVCWSSQTQIVMVWPAVYLVRGGAHPVKAVAVGTSADECLVSVATVGAGSPHYSISAF
jgi:hypothetical protein